MKKINILISILICTFLLTGCGEKNTYTCSYQMVEDGIKITEKIEAKLDSDKKVEALTLIVESDNKEYLDSMYEFYKTYNDSASSNEKIVVSKSDNTITIENAEKILQSEDDKYIGISKEEFDTKVKQGNNEVICE